MRTPLKILSENMLLYHSPHCCNSLQSEPFTFKCYISSVCCSVSCIRSLYKKLKCMCSYIIQFNIRKYFERIFRFCSSCLVLAEWLVYLEQTDLKDYLDDWKRKESKQQQESIWIHKKVVPISPVTPNVVLCLSKYDMFVFCLAYTLVLCNNELSPSRGCLSRQQKHRDILAIEWLEKKKRKKKKRWCYKCSFPFHLWQKRNIFFWERS